MVQRQSMLATAYQQRNKPKAQQPPLRTQSLHDKGAAKRNAIRMQSHSALSYNTVAFTDSKCLICAGDHTFITKAGETRSWSSFMDYAYGFMKKTPEEHSKVIGAS